MENHQYDEITPEEFQAWVDSKITKLVVAKLMQRREEVTVHVMTGKCNDSDPMNSYDFHTGQVRGLMELFMLFEEAEEDVKEAATPEVIYDH